MEGSIVAGYSVWKFQCNMKYLIFSLLLFVIIKGHHCGKKKGVCKYAQPAEHFIRNCQLSNSWWRIYGYIESGAPYRNPFYVPYQESFDCNRIWISGFEHSEIGFHCEHKNGPVEPCLRLSFGANNTLLTFNYWPYTNDDMCQEWNTVNNYQTDCINYFILFGCENGKDDSHYMGLWIFISAETDFTREQEGVTKKEVHRIIEKDFRYIKNDIVFVQNFTSTNYCECRQDQPIFSAQQKIKCPFERLNICVLKELDMLFSIMMHLQKRLGLAIVFILLIVGTFSYLGYNKHCNAWNMQM